MEVRLPEKEPEPGLSSCRAVQDLLQHQRSSSIQPLTQQAACHKDCGTRTPWDTVVSSRRIILERQEQ